ncbi:MAG: hypothetical protein GTO53_05145 [Planctomycetales bacterium]|nr:hypothetical protein [Planctomycetales bacterium]NIM08539.1 hypothetical protein [Planctomycetales bacterium]NIN08010.1 hypothetical protein [Planctomycetales bacterium]NIN77139.1 hypothetical protein [Planctomycetales bacterium]NIO34323.1 hypothetical protein [Planctomycetales bacterium]
MELNRNHFFLVGLLILFVGIQLRAVDLVVLNEPSTKFIAQKMGSQKQVAKAEIIQTASFGKVKARKVIAPPRWIGWALISAGTVFILHALSLRKPG